MFRLKNATDVQARLWWHRDSCLAPLLCVVSAVAARISSYSCHGHTLGRITHSR